MSDLLSRGRRLRLVVVDGKRCGHISEPPTAIPFLVPPREGEKRAMDIARAIEAELFEWSEVGTDTETVRRVDVSCHVGLVADGEHWVGHTENLGARGAFVASYLARPIGARLRALIELPTTQTIDVLAIVSGQRLARVGSMQLPGMQLAFDTMSSEDMQRLRDVLHMMSVDFWRATS